MDKYQITTNISGIKNNIPFNVTETITNSGNEVKTETVKRDFLSLINDVLNKIKLINENILDHYDDDKTIITQNRLQESQNIANSHKRFLEYRQQ